MDREAWHAAVHGVAKSWTRLSDFTFTVRCIQKEVGMADWETGIWEAGDGEEHSITKPRSGTVVNKRC